MKLLIPCQSGLESVVKRQLKKLNYGETKAENGRVQLESCTFYDVAYLNMALYSGERVLINLKTFPATTFDELYEGIRSISWQNFLSADSKIYVITKSIKSKLFAHNAIQSISKKAIVDSLSKKLNTTLEESGANTTVEIDITEDIASINIDTSGLGLHKRGYRSLAYPAPLKETTAAALIDLSVWHKQKEFCDIFCGSGTLPIEATLQGLNIAPNLSRDFDFLHWDCHSEKDYLLAKESLKDNEIDVPLEIYGSDIDENAISISQYHAKRAGVEKKIKFEVKDAKHFRSRNSFGVNISNIPYDHRMEANQNDLAKMLGQVYKSQDNYNFYILTPNQQFERYFGRRADKKRKLFNAGIMCSYYTFNGKKPAK